MTIKTTSTTKTELSCDYKGCLRTSRFFGSLDDINFEPRITVSVNSMLPAGWRIVRVTGMHGTESKPIILCGNHASIIDRPDPRS